MSTTSVAEYITVRQSILQYSWSNARNMKTVINTYHNFKFRPDIYWKISCSEMIKHSHLKFSSWILSFLIFLWWTYPLSLFNGIIMIPLKLTFESFAHSSNSLSPSSLLWHPKWKGDKLQKNLTVTRIHFNTLSMK